MMDRRSNRTGTSVRFARSGPTRLHAVGGDAGAIHVSLGAHKFARTAINRGWWRESGMRDVSASRFRSAARRCGLVWESRWVLGLVGPRSHAGIRYTETPCRDHRTVPSTGLCLAANMNESILRSAAHLLR